MIQRITKRTRQVQKVEGDLLPEHMLTTEGCMLKAGLGENSLIEARRSGLVTPIPVGKRCYYRGSELIAWIESHAQSQ